MPVDKPPWLIGYARVSTRNRNLDLQINALKEAGVAEDQIFTDTMSGARSAQPSLVHCRKALKKGDVLVVWKLDRLGRNVRGILEMLEFLKERGVELKALTESIDTMTPTGTFVLQILAAMAQMERDLIIEKVLAGQEAARRRGVKMGRPGTMTPERAKRAKELLDRGWSKASVANEIKVSRATVYNWLKRDREEPSD